MRRASKRGPGRRALVALLGVVGVVTLAILVVVPISSAGQAGLPLPKSPVSASTLVAQAVHSGAITPATGSGPGALRLRRPRFYRTSRRRPAASR